MSGVTLWNKHPWSETPPTETCIWLNLKAFSFLFFPFSIFEVVVWNYSSERSTANEFDVKVVAVEWLRLIECLSHEVSKLSGGGVFFYPSFQLRENLLLLLLLLPEESFRICITAITVGCGDVSHKQLFKMLYSEKKKKPEAVRVNNQSDSGNDRNDILRWTVVLNDLGLGFFLLLFFWLSQTALGL